MTMLTDYVLAGVCLVLALRLSRRAGRERSVALWAGGLAATAAAALLGGSSHGFAPYLAGTWTAALWIATYTLIGLANLLLLSGGVFAVAAGALRRGLLAALLARFAVATAFLCAQRSFRYVIYDLGVTLLALTALAAHRALAGRARRLLAAAIAVSFAAALVQQSPLAAGPFDHNDLFHLVQTAGLYLLYRAGLLLADARRAG